jgi:hypothetical protein
MDVPFFLDQMIRAGFMDILPMVFLDQSRGAGSKKIKRVVSSG